MVYGIIKKLVGFTGIDSEEDRQKKLLNDLIRHEAKIGGGVFGPVPRDVHREFFCLNEHTWVWHEERTDDQGQERIQTTTYNVKPNGIVKSQNGQHYQKVSDQEALRLLDAARAYKARTSEEIYSSLAS